MFLLSFPQGVNENFHDFWQDINIILCVFFRLYDILTMLIVIY